MMSAAKSRLWEMTVIRQTKNSWIVAAVKVGIKNATTHTLDINGYLPCTNTM